MSSTSSEPLPPALATSLALEPIRSAFDKRKSETRRWSPERTKEWMDEVVQSVIGNKKACADCNAWLMRVSFVMPKNNPIAPTVEDRSNVQAYIEFLWLAADSDVQHTKAVEPVHLARERWGCQSARNIYRTVHDVYADDEATARITRSAAREGRRSETTPHKTRANTTTTSTSTPGPNPRRTKQKEKRHKNKSDHAIASSVPPQSRETKPSTRNRRRTDSPHTSTHADSVSVALGEACLTSSTTISRTTTAPCPSEVPSTDSGESEHEHSVHPGAAVQNTTSLVALTMTDHSTTLDEEPLDVVMASPVPDAATQDSPVDFSVEITLPSTNVEAPSDGLSHDPSVTHLADTANAVKPEPRSADDLDNLLRMTPFPEVDVKPTVTPTHVPIGLQTDAPAQSSAPVSTPAIVPPRPLLSAYGLRPPIWAQSRQEVCECTDYFKAYQGGVYFNKDQVYGYLLGGFPSKRDAFEHGGRLIISHGGGGKPEASYNHRTRALHKEMETGDQHLEDRSVRALLSNWRNHYPVVLLADDHYALFPFDIASEHYVYIVLGYYWVTNVWAECDGVRENQDKIIRYKVAFQWCDGQGDPWWTVPSPQTHIPTASQYPPVVDPYAPVGAPPGSDGVTLFTHNGPTSHEGLQCSMLSQARMARRCSICAAESVQVYTVGWMCLNSRCRAFWALDGLAACPMDGLSFDPTFTALQAQPQDMSIVGMSLIPPPPPTGGSTAVITSRRYSRGMHCAACGRLSCRHMWSRYKCSTEGCKTEIMVEAGVRGPREFLTQTDTLEDSDDVYDSRIIVRPEVMMHSKAGDGFIVTSYILPYGRGQIHRVRSPPRLNRKANEIFRAYQEQAATGDLEFRRFPLRAHQCRGTLLTGYFSQNSGAPYNYIGGSDFTLPLGHGGSSAVLEAVNLIKQRVEVVIGEHVPFNEIMSVAYMEDQRMAFHADAERGLGPVVASLSLGSTSQMHFRRSKHDIADNDVPKAFHVLTLVLKHGDILIMQGSEIQDYYEHTVEPMGFRMVATARVIAPENYAATNVKIES